ncbi:MAG: putative glycoside hydrolase [Nitrospirae bacterium]|nr:putative glycoside hydrolase [Nitrospirota bacterium]
MSLMAPGTTAAALVVKVVDSNTKKPIRDAIVTVGNGTFRTDNNGTYNVSSPATKVAVRAYGYTRNEQVINGSDPVEVKLTPFVPRALYMSFYGIGDRKLRNSALDLIEHTELNALVIDVKGDRGMINYKSSVALASEIGAQKIITVRDVRELIKNLKGKGIYLIARIVVFKDNLLAQARPGLAIKRKSGDMWRDREKLAWVEPFSKEVWEYNIKIAEEAAQLGFDEIQFDYVRFPDVKGLTFSMPNTQENRIKAISGFLNEARKRLEPYNVFISADIFGYVCWNLDDTQIGQKIEDVVNQLDYVSPMLYPSGFQFGIPEYKNPVANSNKIVYLSLKRAQARTNVPTNRFRPWLQAFKDYAFDRRHFTAKEIKEQVSAAEQFGSHGWMLWNPRNNYTNAGLKSK